LLGTAQLHPSLGDWVVGWWQGFSLALRLELLDGFEIEGYPQPADFPLEGLGWRRLVILVSGAGGIMVFLG
jgi:hypothetical protein